ncbi:MAG: Ldh family oxidoreductase [Sulfuricaulis sp.]|nr:Ldh family oxidoreductase [Sulfuricaulis sp.]
MEQISPDRVRLTVDAARDLARSALGKLGYDREEADIVAEHMLDAALCGYEYSGLPKILNVAEHPQLRKPRRPMRAIHETAVSVLYDGGNNVGMVTMYHAARTAIAKALEHGYSIVGVNNSWVTGRGAHYVEMIARAGLIGIHPVSSTHHVAPPGGRIATLGTNPIAFAFPTAREPLVIDMGTSAFMHTDLLLRIRRGEQLPEDVAIDAQGRPTRDPAAADKGALLPFGGHKGYALAMAMQAFGVLAGSGMQSDKCQGFLIIAIKPDLLLPLEEYKQGMTEMIERIKMTPRQPGVAEIRIPSERAFRERARRMREGISIDRKIYDALAALPQSALPDYQ